MALPTSLNARRFPWTLGVSALTFLAACSADVGRPEGSAPDGLDLSGLAPIVPLSFDTVDVLTQRNDNARTGSSVHTGLNASTFDPANAWGYLGEIDVAGQVWAQPLYVGNIAMNDGRTHDVVYVATANTEVSAWDANTLQRLWSVRFTTNGVALMQATPVIDRARGRIYVSFQAPNSDGSKNPGVLEHRIAALSLANGAIVQTHIISSSIIDSSGNCSWATELCGSRDAFGNRPALLLVNNLLYVAFGGAKEGLNPKFDVDARYRGQLLAFDADSLGFAGRFVTTEAGAFGSRIGGGIWQGSVGPAADANGEIFVTTGNVMSNSQCDNATGPHLCANDAQCGGGHCRPPTQSERATNSSPEVGSYANSVIHLHPEITMTQPGQRGVSINPVASFTPYRSYWHNETDLDFGSAGAVLIPGTDEVVAGGKEGILYVLDRNGMASTSNPLRQSEYNNWQQQTYAWPSCSGLLKKYQPNDPSGDGARVIQEIAAGRNFDIPEPPMDCWGVFPHVHGTPIYGELSDGNGYMYVWPEKDYLKAYRRQSTSPVTFTAAPAGKSASAAPVPLGMPGGLLALTTDPSGGGVLFATVPIDGGESNFPSKAPYGSLHAYNPIPDANGQLQELWNDHSTIPYNFAKFNPPMIGGNKHVYVPTFSNKVIVYGAQSNDPIARSTHFSVPGGHVAAIHQDVQNKQVTAATIASDGAVHIFWEMNNQPWLASQSATVTPAGIAPPGAPLTIAAEADGRTFDTFFVDYNGAVNWLSVIDGQAWVNHGPISENGFAPIGASITTSIQGTSTLDAFVVGSDGSVNVFWKPAGATSFGHGPLPGSAGRFMNGEMPIIWHPGSTPHRFCSASRGCAHFAVGRRPGTTLSLVGADDSGMLQEFVLAQDGGPWSAPNAVAGAPALPAAGGIAGGSHGTGVIAFDIGYVANDGSVHTAVNETGSWFWKQVAPAGFAPAGAEVSAQQFATTKGTTLFFFLSGNEGAVDAFGYDPASQSWSAPLSAHTPSFGGVEPGQPIGAAIQSSTANEEVIDYFYAGKTGVYVSYKLPAPGWSRPGWIFH